MARRLVVLVVFMAAAAALLAAQPKHRVVFEVSVEGEAQWHSILNNVSNLLNALGRENTQVEVVTHGKGVGLLTIRTPAFRERLQKLSEAGVVFAACSNSIRARNLKPEELAPFAIPVDSGVAHIVRKQELGWAYIKSGE